MNTARKLSGIRINFWGAKLLQHRERRYVAIPKMAVSERLARLAPDAQDGLSFSGVSGLRPLMITRDAVGRVLQRDLRGKLALWASRYWSPRPHCLHTQITQRLRAAANEVLLRHPLSTTASATLRHCKQPLQTVASEDCE